MTCDRTTTDVRARDPRMSFVSLSAWTRAPESQSRPDRRDTLSTDLRLTCNALRPISDRPTTWARPPRVTCLARQKFAWDKHFKSDLRSIYDRVEWHTRPPSDLRPTCDQRRIQLRVGSLASEIDKFHDRFWRLKAIVCSLSISVASKPQLLRVFRSNLWPSADNIGGTYDLADQLPSNHEFGHFLVISQS